jgi:hypothetical protein
MSVEASASEETRWRTVVASEENLASGEDLDDVLLQVGRRGQCTV